MQESEPSCCVAMVDEQGEPRIMSAEWREVHKELMANIRAQNFAPKDGQSVYVKIDGKKVHLPAYVPYVGHAYFEYRPRVFCYAINQNLSPHVPWTDEWVNWWATDEARAHDRLNNAVHKGRPIPIRPYAEGFIPLVALLAICRWIREHGGKLPRTIDEVVAVTNFVKFSTAKDASSSSIPLSWWRECARRYVVHEIRALRPDIIIAFGQRTHSELGRVLCAASEPGYQPELLCCRFPARIASVKARPLGAEEAARWGEEVVPLLSRMAEPTQKIYHEWRMKRFPGYFLDVIGGWDSTSG